jgi:serine/threonine protein kinase
MSSDRTQHQSSADLKKTRDLSLEPTRPPADVVGYTLQKFLGSGAYGEVWSAIDKKTGRSVAIKFYTRRSSSDVQLLAAEVQKLVVLAADRYVVQLLDVGWDADPPYYVMDLIEHGSLEQRLRGGQGMPVNEAVELFTEIATGMMHLHGKGILHCDLKPGNVLLDQDGKPRVADFGQSRLSTDETPALGTLYYMAPEQADLEALPDAKWDVYGLGALLFSMLTGKPPYHSASLTNKIESSVDITERLTEYRRAILSAPKPTDHRTVPGVDRALADIIDRCISAKPAHRFDSIQSVLFALRQRELTRARRPVMLLGLIGPILLTTVVTLFGWWAFREAVARTDDAITTKAVESNLFAAKLAARSAAEQIDEYFQAVIELTQDAAFLEQYEKFLNDEAAQKLASQLAHPRLNAQQDLQPRRDFIQNETRKNLQPFLNSRLFDRLGKYPFAASWVVLDRAGTQVASVFRGTNTTLGRNYCYRTYFTGEDKDLKLTRDEGSVEYQVADDPLDRKIIDRAHLSAVFSSRQSNTWKIGFSAPILVDQKVRGVVLATVELGSFIEFENGAHQYAMLVDSRDGEFTGAILEHPLFKAILRQGDRIPDELTETRVIDVEKAKEWIEFRDPIGASATDEASPQAAYDRQGLAAWAPVTVNAMLMAEARQLAVGTYDKNTTTRDSLAESRIETGLHVVAVEDKNYVIEPAHALGRTLGRLSLLALLFLSLVALGMWLLVNRMLKESRERMSRAFSPSGQTGTNSFQDLPTLAASPDSDKTSAVSSE